LGELGEKTYEIEKLTYHGNGSIYIYYYDDGEEKTYIQKNSNGYVNDIVYGEVV
jgi:hypothetical protein